MVKSFIKTKRGPNTFLVAYVFEEDPCIKEYKALDLSGMNCVSIVYGKDRNMVNVLNYLSTTLYPDCDYYSEVNDDHVFISNGWDIKMMCAINKKNNGVAIAYGYTKNLPTATMFGGILVRSFGYFFPPEFNHTWVDNWLADIGFFSNILTYVPTVIIEHRHHLFGLAEKDSVYDSVDKDMSHGNSEYFDWVKTRRDNDCAEIERLKEKNNTPNTMDDDFFAAYFNQSDSETIYPYSPDCVISLDDIGFIEIDKKILLKHRLPANFSPSHPDWKIPSFKNRYAEAKRESKLENL